MAKIKQTSKKPSQTGWVLDDHAFLAKLIVGIGEVAEITGIPQRQLRYWQQKGIIHVIKEPGKASTRRFGYSEIKKIVIIKEMLDEGYTLGAANKKIKHRLELINTTFQKLKK